MDRDELIVVGAGRAGVAAALRAASLGTPVLLIERAEPGGRYEPERLASRAVAAAGRAVAARRRQEFGLDPHDPTFRFVRLVEACSRAAELSPAERPATRLEAAGVRQIAGEARLVAPLTLTVGERTLPARRILLAPGSREEPVAAAAATGLRLDSARGLLARRVAPRTSVLIGLEPERLALAQALGRLGSSVTVLGFEDRPPWGFSAAAWGLLGTALAADGVRLLAGQQVVAARDGRDGQVLSLGSRNGGALPASEHAAGGSAGALPGELIAELVLAAPVEVADVEALRLELGGVARGTAGIAVDARLRTSAAAVGCAGSAAFPGSGAAASRQQGIHAVECLLGEGRGDYQPGRLAVVVPTEPELARVGRTEGVAASGGGILEASAALRPPGGPAAGGVGAAAGPGFVRLLCDRSGALLGAEAAGDNAGVAVELVALALAGGADVDALADLAADQPVLGALQRAAERLRSERRGSLWQRIKHGR